MSLNKHVCYVMFPLLVVSGKLAINTVKFNSKGSCFQLSINCLCRFTFSYAMSRIVFFGMFRVTHVHAEF